MADVSIASPPSAVSAGSVADRSLLLTTYALLTVLVWGLFAFDRGFWGDDALTLYLVASRTGLELVD